MPYQFLQNIPPIDRLPVELLSYIFLLGTHTSSATETKTLSFDTDSVTTPLVFSSVNSRWRKVALSTPTLWTSICVTIGDVFSGAITHSTPQDPSEMPQTGHLAKYISLSRRSPLDILIDARDPDWDFSENDVASHINPYVHPFRPSHMNTCLDLLLPHIKRWRSLAILTDTWSPMYIALARLNSSLASSAPLLESLTLMRCNQFACYPSEFHPREMRNPEFLPFGETLLSSADGTSPLPRLRTLNLTGVHVNWSALSHILPTPSSDRAGGARGLHTLELSYHAHEVRPSQSEFCKILRVCPELKTLVVKASGPVLFEEDETPERTAQEIHQSTTPIPLPKLEDLTLGYISALDGCNTIDLLDAPNVKVFTLEDANHPADPREEDAECLLNYLATGVIDESSRHHPSPSPAAKSTTGVDGTRRDDASPQVREPEARDEVTSPPLPPSPSTSSLSSTPALTLSRTPSPAPAPTAPFPHLQDLTLTRVKACPGPFKTFFAALPELQRLELGHTSEHAAHGLLPQSGMAESCPCPSLNELCARGEHADLDFIVGGLVERRKESGASGIKEVEVWVEDGEGVCCWCGVCGCGGCDEGENSSSGGGGGGGGGGGVSVDVMSILGTDVKVFRESCQFGCDFDGVRSNEDHDGFGSDFETDPFALGGTFNDPAFDEYYGGHLLLLSQ